jgi:predicted MFS family arabinose efflux permease
MLQNILHNYRQSFSGLSKQTWLLSLVMMINRAGTMAVPFMSMYVTQSQQRSLSDAGLIITLYGVGSILGASTGGFMVDKIGFRPVQVFTSIVSGLLFILFAFVEDFSQICLLVVLLSFVAEAFRPANFTAIAAYSKPENITRSYSLNRLAINIGWASGASLGGIIAAFDYQWLFFVDGATNIAAGLLIVLLLPSAKVQKASSATANPPAVVKKPWQDGFFVRFILLTAVFNTCFFLVFRLVPVYWKQQWQMGESTIGIVLGMNGVIIALFEMLLVNRWEGKRSPMQYIVAGCIANAIGFCVLLLPGMAPLLLAMVCMCLITLGEMLALPFMNAMIMQRSNAFNRGQYAAGYTLSWSVAQVIGPAGGAWIAQHAGYTILWIVLTVVCIVCGFLYTWLNKHQHKYDIHGAG